MKKWILSAIMAGILYPVVLASQAEAQSASPTVYGVQLEEFEFRRGDEGEDLFVWNMDAFIGNDEVRFRWLSSGEYNRKTNSFEGMENHFVAQVPVSTFFDVKAGIRVDTPKGPDRWYGTVGFTGLAPQWIDVNADLFVSEKGDVSARLDAEYELLLTNRLILTPSADINVAFSDDTEIDIKSGLTSAELGLRLSYDVVDRLFSPYVGVVYERKLGDTADLARTEGGDIESWFGVVGLKMVF
ncbi:MAG: copper resistance protein B [Alphaproteobacteria bacterium]|jgi:copper resistance protein B